MSTLVTAWGIFVRPSGEVVSVKKTVSIPNPSSASSLSCRTAAPHLDGHSGGWSPGRLTDSPACGYPRCSLGCWAEGQNGFHEPPPSSEPVCAGEFHAPAMPKSMVPLRQPRTRPLYPFSGWRESTHRRGLRSRLERNRLVNSEGGVNQRFGDFLAEISGSGVNRHGCFGTLLRLSRNRDSFAGFQIAATQSAEDTCQRRKSLPQKALTLALSQRAKGPEKQNARRPKGATPGVPWFGGKTGCFAESSAKRTRGRKAFPAVGFRPWVRPEERPDHGA